jgi:creatinine amidohydrolase/Fe(II)-dependent formamide hydrolase-like protein
MDTPSTESVRDRRPFYWLFAISVALFVSGIGFVIAAERTARSAAPVEAAVSLRAAPPVANVKQIMNGVVMPSAGFIWDSVATIVSGDGVEERRPRSDEEWAQVATSAAMLVESANLLVDGDRAVDRGDWVKMAQAMAESGQKALEAAKAKSPDGILAVGEEINVTCDNCHERYSRN